MEVLLRNQLCLSQMIIVIVFMGDMTFELFLKDGWIGDWLQNGQNERKEPHEDT